MPKFGKHQTERVRQLSSMKMQYTGQRSGRDKKDLKFREEKMTDAFDGDHLRSHTAQRLSRVREGRKKMTYEVKGVEEDELRRTNRRESLRKSSRIDVLEPRSSSSKNLRHAKPK
jgi:hypothetical protein